MTTENDSILILGFSNCVKKKLINQITNLKIENSKIISENHEEFILK
jgi:hypothetical protein